MRLFQASLAALAGVGAFASHPRPATAQTPVLKREELIGTWTWVLDTSRERWKGDTAWQGHPIVNYLTLNADSSYTLKVEADHQPRAIGEGPGGEIPLSLQGREGGWSARVDTVRFGRNGKYIKYRAKLQGQELTLINSLPTGDPADPHYSECTYVFVRWDSTKPLPAPNSKDSCQTIAGALPKSSLPKAAELLGTWAVVDSSMWRGKPLCTGDAPCPLVTYDTVIFRADSTLTHAKIVVSPGYPNGEKDAFGNVHDLRWWVAFDTPWTSFVITMNGKVVEYVYDGQTRKKAEPVRRPVIAVAFEDDGRYLLYDGRVYHRVAGAP